MPPLSHFTRCYKGAKCTRELNKLIPATVGEGYTSVTSRQEITFDVYLDWGAVNELARKAAKNKSGSSKVGPMRVVVTNRKTVI